MTAMVEHVQGEQEEVEYTEQGQDENTEQGQVENTVNKVKLKILKLRIWEGTAVWTRIEMCRDFFVKASLTFC